MCPKSVSDVNTKYQRKLFTFYPDHKRNIKKIQQKLNLYSFSETGDGEISITCKSLSLGSQKRRDGNFCT